MKKLLVSVMALSIISVGSAANASALGNWFTNVGNKITKAESDVSNAKAQAKAEQKAQKKAAEARKAATKKAVNDEISFWKKLFTWNWD